MGDDSQLVVTSTSKSDLEKKIEKIISMAQSWYMQNSMMNNIDKTELIIFNPKDKRDKTNIEILDGNNKIILKSKEHIKILGLYIDNELKWTNKSGKEKIYEHNQTGA